MTRRTTRLPILALVAVAAALLLTVGSDDSGRVAVHLGSANGLREGTVVKVAGAEVGVIDELKVTDEDNIVAELKLDGDQAGAMHEGASARVVTSNLLGSKYIDLSPGKAGGPEVDEIPSSRVTYPVDLDQVLNVLDRDTRARLQILINEAGTALVGRAADFNVVLRQLPRDFSAAQRLVDRVTRENDALGATVDSSSRFVARIRGERRELGRMVDVARTTVSRVAQHRAALSHALEEAPGTLTTANRFLAELRGAVRPLRPGARALTATAGPLEDVLDEVPAFTDAAVPTLNEARRVAPTLTSLGDVATPILRRARPTLTALGTVAQSSAPLTRTLDVSVDDTLGLIEGWARSIQQGDALGHIFRGKAIASAELVRSLLDTPLPLPANKGKQQPKRPGLLTPLPAPANKPATNPVGKPVIPPVRLPDLKIPPIKLPGVPPISIPGLTSNKGEGDTKPSQSILNSILGS